MIHICRLHDMQLFTNKFLCLKHALKPPFYISYVAFLYSNKILALLSSWRANACSLWYTLCSPVTVKRFTVLNLD